MRIALIGQAQFGEAVFNALREAGEQIVAVSSIEGTPDRPDQLAAAARAAAIPFFPTGKLKKPAVLDEYAATQPDLCVMAFVTHILPEPVLFAPTYGSIQYHPSLLPRHRGRSAMHWAIRMGDSAAGVTIFWVDKGIDTGPILLQRECSVGPDDTVGSLYFDRMFPMGVEMLTESVRLVREGTAPRIEQDESRATYEPPAGDDNSAIDWTRPAREVYNLIRGSNPQPGAHCILYATKVRLFDCTATFFDDAGDRSSTTSQRGPSARALPDASETQHPEGGTRLIVDGLPPTGAIFVYDGQQFDAGAGSILAANDQQIDIALDGGILHLKRAQRDGGKKLPAPDFAAEMGIEVGDSFEPAR